MSNATLAACVMCDARTYVEPLHDDKGGPLTCPVCAGKWHAKQARLRKWRRIIMNLEQAVRAGDDAGNTHMMPRLIHDPGRDTPLPKALDHKRRYAIGSQGKFFDQVGHVAPHTSEEFSAPRAGGGGPRQRRGLSVGRRSRNL